MTTVTEILKGKPEAVTHTISPGASVFEAVKLMALKNIGALLVVEAGKVVGIVTERDYARKIALLERVSKDTPVSEIMSSPVMYVHPQQTCEECMALMTENRLRQKTPNEIALTILLVALTIVFLGVTVIRSPMPQALAAAAESVTQLLAEYVSTRARTTGRSR